MNELFAKISGEEEFGSGTSLFMASVREVSTKADLEALASKAVIFFWAQWHEPSALGGQMDQVFRALASKHPGLIFARCEAEACPALSATYSIEVPQRK